MENFGFTCDVCGKTVCGITYVNGMKFCAKCYQETFGNKNERNLDAEMATEMVKLAEENKHLKERIQNILEGKEIPAICAKKYEEYEEKLDKVEQELAFYQDEIKNRGTCGLCEKLDIKRIKELEEEISKLETQKKQLEWDNRNKPYYEYHKMIEHQQEAIEHYFKETIELKEALKLACNFAGLDIDKWSKYFIEQAKESMK